MLGVLVFDSADGGSNPMWPGREPKVHYFIILVHGHRDLICLCSLEYHGGWGGPQGVFVGWGDPRGPLWGWGRERGK